MRGRSSPSPQPARWWATRSWYGVRMARPGALPSNRGRGMSLRSSEPVDRQGVLLLEALIGLTIIGVVAVALLAATASHVRSAGKASSLLEAAALAQDRLAAIRLLNYQQLTNPPDSLLAGQFPAPFQDYRWIASVEPVDDEYDLFNAKVEVVGKGERYPMETLLHRSSIVAVGGGAGGLGAGG